jgi:holo-[acyl-carrier protein] synthase
MILGIGTDLISIDRIQHLILKFKENFIKKIFTTNEALQASKIKSLDENSLQLSLFYAKRFAAKEAFSKAIGLGIGRGINFHDIEIYNDNLGKPQIKILNDKENFLKKHFNCNSFNIHLSISDDKTLANAMVVIEKIS